MPGRVSQVDLDQIVADLLIDRRRMSRALTSVQMPQPAKDTFTVASTPATTYTLSAIPYQGTLGSSLNLSLNGLELVEGVDYTVDYTTAIVTVTATLKGTPTPADVLTADYWTTGDLSAASGPVDPGEQTVTYITGTTAHADHTAGASTTITMPSGLTAGDRMLLFVWDQGGTFQTPSGWTLLQSATSFGALYTKVAGTSEPSLTYTFAAAPGDRALVLRAYRGASRTPSVVTSAEADAANVSTVTSPTVAYDRASTIVYGWGGYEAFAAGAISPSPAVSNLLGSGEVVIVGQTGDEQVTGAGTSTAHTASGLSGTCNWASFTVLLI